MQGKQTLYYCALHLGRTLKELTAPTDPERNVLSEMMQLLKTRWRDVWPAISQRYTHTQTDRQTRRQTQVYVSSRTVDHGRVNLLRDASARSYDSAICCNKMSIFGHFVAANS